MSDDKRKKLEPIFDKIEKIFAMLRSDKDGEVLSAVGKLKEILAGAGLDLHDLWDLGWAQQKDDILAAFAAMMAAKDADKLVDIALKGATFFLNDAVYADIQ